MGGRRQGLGPGFHAQPRGLTGAQDGWRLWVCSELIRSDMEAQGVGKGENEYVYCRRL